MQKRLSLWFLGLVLGICSIAQAQSSIYTTVSLTGGPTPNPAVVGQTVSMNWKATISGADATQTECLVKNASWTWSMDSYKFTPTGSTTTTTLDFTQDPNKVSLQPSGDSARTSVVPATGGGTYTLTVRAKYSCTSSGCGVVGTIPDATGTASFDVKPLGSFVLHPNANDFQGSYSGRVLISKQRGDSFYTINNTSASNTPAQTGTGNHQIFITAQLPKDQVGTTVYFRISDPADASPYHSTGGNDNGWAGGSAGTAPGTQSAVASLATIDGSQVAAAEITLDIGTDAGNNFDVEASLKPFSTATASDIQKTPRLVAWKRCYLEQDNTYQGGSATTSAVASSTGDTFLPLSNVNGLSVGTNVLISFPSSKSYGGVSYNNITRQILGVDTTGNRIRVANIPFSIDQYTGVTPVGSGQFQTSTSLITSGYGSSTDGSDVGAFVEFVGNIQGSGVIPQYGPYAWDSPDWFQFRNAWFKNSSANSNVFQLVSSNPSTSAGYLGVTSAALHISTVYTAPDAVTNQESVVHELGHQFSLPLGANGHVDLNVTAPNAAVPSNDSCIMSYNQTVGSGHVKFDILCYKTIRGNTDPVK